MARKRSKAIADSDEAALNMTPMIDMTFLLVVFFMVTIDLTQKEFIPVALPFARQGIEDTEKTADPTQRLVINLTSDGTIQFKTFTLTLSSEDRAAQNASLKKLYDELGRLARDPSVLEEDGSSKVPVMIHADRDAKWEYVQWIMQVCSLQNVQVYKLQFATKKPVAEEDR